MLGVRICAGYNFDSLASPSIRDQSTSLTLVTRQAYMKAAARIKPNREAVYDADRIEDVVSKVLIEADKLGLSRDIAEPVWRKLIECCIAHEFDVWDKTL